MNKQELYDKINQLPSLLGWKSCGAKVMVAKDSVLELVRQLDEPQKVVVPRFVAEWIEECKSKKSRLFDALMDNEAVNDWLDWGNGSNEDLFARSWLDGYTIEQEKLYTVEIPNPNSTLNEFQVLALAKNGHGEIQITQFLPGYDWKNDGRCQLTESEIRKDFDWAWQAGFAKEVG